jgi:hypothetical protein
MTTGGGAGDGAEQTAPAEVRLRITPVAREDVGRLAEMFARLPAVAGVRTLAQDGDAATYAVETPSRARLLTELGQVAVSIGAAVTRTIGGDIVLALPSGAAPQFSPESVTPSPSHPATDQPDRRPPSMDPDEHPHTGVDHPEGGHTRAERKARTRLRAVPGPDEPRTSPLSRLRDRLVAWRQRQARARRGRSVNALLGVIVLAAVIALSLTVSDQCGDGGSSSTPSNRDTVEMLDARLSRGA